MTSSLVILEGMPHIWLKIFDGCHAKNPTAYQALITEVIMNQQPINYQFSNHRYHILPLNKHPAYITQVASQLGQQTNYHPQAFNHTWLLIDSYQWPLKDLAGIITLSVDSNSPLQSPHCAIDCLYIADKYRQQGLETALIAFCQSYYQTLDYKWMGWLNNRITTMPPSKPAQLAC